MKAILLVALISLVLCGCQSNSGLAEKVDQQQTAINDLNAKITKMEMQINQMQQEMSGVKGEFTKVKDDVKKVQPKYIENAIQEGGN